MNTISFNTANFVAREIGYDMPNGWGQGANDWFRPINSYAERFDAMLAEIDNLGFKAVDLWAAHLNSAWATPEHIAIANGCLSQRNMTVSSYACGGSTIPEFRASCRVSALIEAPVIGVGSSLLDTARVRSSLRIRKPSRKIGKRHPDQNWRLRPRCHRSCRRHRMVWNAELRCSPGPEGNRSKNKDNPPKGCQGSPQSA
jgi:L-ribulose-5-phosphate 3-epimerase